MKIKPVFFESLGAKSSCIFIKTEDVKVVIDPGIAALQPGFPAPEELKEKWKEEGKEKIIKACEKADIIVITHYHYDHFLPNDLFVYECKIILAKNPNEYINDSQRKRAEEFYKKLSDYYNFKLKARKVKREFKNPLEDLKISLQKDFGSYNKRRKEIIKKGLGWFERRVSEWNRNPYIFEINERNIKVFWADSREFKFGDTIIKFTHPMFHGIEFSRLGWVIGVKINDFFFTSDLNGIYIEDYAERIIKENPKYIIIDGPPTYMQFMITKTNLRRCIENTLRILKSCDLRWVIYDHHLLRDVKYKEKTKEIWKFKNVLTAAEFLRKKPIANLFKSSQ